MADSNMEEIPVVSEEIKNAVWKGKKVEVYGEIMQKNVKLWDCELPELQQYYDHCETMLYNESKSCPGRIPLLEIVRDQRRRCNCELFLRWLDSKMGMSKFRFMEAIRAFVDAHRDEDPDILKKPISIMTDGCPDEFSDLTLSLVLDGCLDTLGRFDRKHITLLFIARQGICLTPAEKSALHKKGIEGSTSEKLAAIKKQLDLNTPIKLFASPTGLSYEQFKALIYLRCDKYSALTTIQLSTLRNRILFLLEDSIQEHIRQWQDREKIIIEISKLKGYDLVR